jgi:hypothetical protein
MSLREELASMLDELAALVVDAASEFDAAIATADADKFREARAKLERAWRRLDHAARVIRG